MKQILNADRVRIAGTSLAVLALLAGAHFFADARSSSVEVGFASLSPNGTAGGSIIPASCSSSFDSGDVQSCTRTNSCGQSNTGVTTDCSGTCSVSAPAESGCPQPPTVYICTGANCTPTSNSTVTVIAGSAVTVKWVCPSPNTSVSGTSNPVNSGFSFSGGALQGTKTATINQSSTFTVACDQTGTQASVTATAINPTASVTATPSRVHSGQTSTISWYASGVTSCTLNGPGTVDGPVTATGGNIASQSSPRQKGTAAITGQSTYTLTCQTSGGPKTASVVVNLVPVEIEL